MWRVTLSLATVGTSPGVRAYRQFIAKIEMTTRYRSVGVKCGCMQECYEGARQGVRSWRPMVQVAMSTKTNKVGAAARPL